MSKSSRPKIEDIMIHYDRRDLQRPNFPESVVKSRVVIDGKKYGGLIPCNGEIRSSVQAQFMLATAVAAAVMRIAEILGEPPLSIWVDRQGNMTREEKP